MADDAGVPHVVLPIDSFSALGGDSLTDELIEVQTEILQSKHRRNYRLVGLDIYGPGATDLSMML